MFRRVTVLLDWSLCSHTLTSSGNSHKNQSSRQRRSSIGRERIKLFCKFGASSRITFHKMAAYVAQIKTSCKFETIALFYPSKFSLCSCYCKVNKALRVCIGNSDLDWWQVDRQNATQYHLWKLFYWMSTVRLISGWRFLFLFLINGV